MLFASTSRETEYQHSQLEFSVSSQKWTQMKLMSLHSIELCLLHRNMSSAFFRFRAQAASFFRFFYFFLTNKHARDEDMERRKRIACAVHLRCVWDARAKDLTRQTSTANTIWMNNKTSFLYYVWHVCWPQFMDVLRNWALPNEAAMRKQRKKSLRICICAIYLLPFGLRLPHSQSGDPNRAVMQKQPGNEKTGKLCFARHVETWRSTRTHW